MKNILFVFEDGRYGGPHSHFINIVNGLSKKINISILFPRKDSFVFDKKLNNKKLIKFKVDILYLSLKFELFIKYIFFFISDTYKIKKIISKNNFDFICVYTGTFSVRSLIAAKILNKKIIWYIHDAYESPINQIIFRLFSKYVYLTIFSSNKSKSNYLSVKNRNLNYLVLQSVINLDEINLKKNIKLKNKKKITILSAGNFSPVKNFELFLEIASINLNTHNFNFKLVGNTWSTQINYRKKLLNLKKKNYLQNLNIINDKNLKSYLDNSDYFICTSKSESSPVLILEAIKRGCIIFSTNVGDMNKNINKYKFGYVINERKLNKIKTTINNIEKNNNQKKKLLINGNLFLKKEHDLKLYLNKFLQKLNI